MDFETGILNVCDSNTMIIMNISLRLFSQYSQKYKNELGLR